MRADIDELDDKFRWLFQLMAVRGTISEDQAEAMTRLLDEIDAIGRDEFGRRVEAILCHENDTSAQT